MTSYGTSNLKLWRECGLECAVSKHVSSLGIYAHQKQRSSEMCNWFLYRIWYTLFWWATEYSLFDRRTHTQNVIPRGIAMLWRHNRGIRFGTWVERPLVYINVVLLLAICVIFQSKFDVKCYSCVSLPCCYCKAGLPTEIWFIVAIIAVGGK